MTTQSQRFCVRLPCELPAEITFSGGGTEHNKKALISNISTTGIQILSPSFVATGQMVQASFKVPGKSTKTTFRAEVMRIESLQGRTIHRYPYALGAKFVTPEKKQEKQITHFISKKITCAPWRMTASLLFLALSLGQLGRALLHTVFSSSSLAQADMQGISLNWLFDPALSAGVSAGLFFGAVFCVLNRTFFIRWGLFWTSAAIFLFVAHLIFQLHVPFSSSLSQMLGIADFALAAWGAGLMIILLKLSTKLGQMEKILSNQRIAPGLNRPTFTIL